MTGSTIDLGVLPPAGRGGEPPPAPAGGWAGRPVAWAAGLLGVLVLLTATAGAAPRQPWAVPHFTVPTGENVEQGGITLTEGILYVHGWTPDEQTLSAYRLSDGALLWQEQAEHVQTWTGKPIAEESGRTSLLDPETGQPRWQGEGYLSAVVGDRLLLATMRRERPMTDGEYVRWPEEVIALDRETAREVWRLPIVDSWSYVAPGAGRPGLVVTTDRQQLSSYDLATGALLDTAEVANLRRGWEPRVVGDVVLIQQREPQLALHAYHLETLGHLWTMGLDHELWDLAPCGELLCFQGGGRAGLTALDPVTGEPQWSGPWLAEVVLEMQWLSGYLIVSDTDGTSNQVIDAATGEEVMELDPWRPRYNGEGGPPGLVTRYDPNRQPVVERLGPNRREMRFREVGRTWFARVHPGSLHLEVLGFVHGGIDGCVVTTGYVACEGGDTVHVWRVR